VNQTVQTTHLQDQAKNTLKQTTLDSWNNFAKAINQTQGETHYQDLAKSTTKQTTVTIPTNTMVRGKDVPAIASQYEDLAKNTLKQITVVIPTNTMVRGKDVANVTLPFTDTANPTIKQITVVIPTNTMARGNDVPAVRTQLLDLAKSTIKETTSAMQLNTFVKGDDKIGLINFFNAPDPTMRQYTEDTQHLVGTKGVIEMKTTTQPQDLAKATIKETTVDTVYIGPSQLNTNQSGYGYMSELRDHQKNTNRQFTSQEVYIQGTQGEIRTRPYNDAYAAQIDDRKEQLLEYHPPTNSSVKVNAGSDLVTITSGRNDWNIQPVMIGYAPGANDRMLSESTTHVQNNTVDQSYSVDPTILVQLANNPYNIQYFFDKN
jgi:hypothetical protein